MGSETTRSEFLINRPATFSIPRRHNRANHPGHIRHHGMHRQEILRTSLPLTLLDTRAAIGTADTPNEPPAG